MPAKPFNIRPEKEDGGLSSFLAEASLQTNSPTVKPKKVIKDTMIRFEEKRLTEIDAAAADQGLTRNAWVNMACKKALENGL